MPRRNRKQKKTTKDAQDGHLTHPYKELIFAWHGKTRLLTLCVILSLFKYNENFVIEMVEFTYINN